jgi:molybdenum cofactor biosynthesis enzyme MoaA
LSLTKKCPFKCVYCGEGGETTISSSSQFDQKWLKEVISTSAAHGVKKFRFTGGEPFVYGHINECIRYVLESGCMLLINTNGLFANRLEENAWPNIQNLHIAVSLDSLKEDVFNTMSSTKGYFTRVMDNIALLKKLGVLLRLNMVVTKMNADEIPAMVDFCLSIGTNLKLQEVVCVPIPFSDWKDLHVPLERYDEYLSGRSKQVLLHSYSIDHGIPVKVYQIGEIFVTNKSLIGGSHYDVDGVCKSCPHYPCHEGLYDLYVLPDHRIATCRWHTIDTKDFAIAIEEGKHIFMHSQYVERDLIQMKSFR